MSAYEVDHIMDGREEYYFLRCMQDLSIVIAPTKYLKHKTKSHRSPRTVKRIAFSLCYYLEYLSYCQLSLDEVYNLKYDKQHIHFTGFLDWVKGGNHTRKARLHPPSNATCNAYLKDVFGWLQFLELQEETHGSLKVLESHVVTFKNSIGLKFSLARKTFHGYFPEDEHIGRTIERSEIEQLLLACDNIRDQLLLLLLSETGFRIGELLGVRYGSDIDVQRHMIRVAFRADNENKARAKNREYRRALIRESTFLVLMNYMALCRDVLKHSDYLFIYLDETKKGQAMTVGSVYAVLRKLERRTGIKATPHMLRHYFANERRKSGWDITLISTALGHKHLETTEKYLNIAGEELEAASQAYFENTKELICADDLL